MVESSGRVRMVGPRPATGDWRRGKETALVSASKAAAVGVEADSGYSASSTGLLFCPENHYSPIVLHE